MATHKTYSHLNHLVCNIRCTFSIIIVQKMYVFILNVFFKNTSKCIFLIQYWITTGEIYILQSLFIWRREGKSNALLWNLWGPWTILRNLCKRTHSTKKIQRTSTMWKNTELLSTFEKHWVRYFCILLKFLIKIQRWDFDILLNF